MSQFATALISSTDATALLTNLTSAVSDNIAAVLIVVGGVAGITWGRKMLNRAVKSGKI